MEPVLREQDHLQKLIDLERQNGIELVPDGYELGRNSTPVAVVPHLQDRGGSGRGDAGSALFRSLIGGAASQPIPGLVDAEVQFDEGGVARLAMVAAQLELTAVKARHRVVQSEADCVEKTRLAGTGLARDEKDAVGVESFEVDDLLVLEGAEPGES